MEHAGEALELTMPGLRYMYLARTFVFIRHCHVVSIGIGGILDLTHLLVATDRRC